MNYRAHALCFPVPAQGHMNPMIEFSKRLASKGVKTTLVTSKFMYKTMQVDPNNHENLLNVEPISDGFDDGGGHYDVNFFVSIFKKVGSQSLSDLIKKINGRNDGQPISVVIYDAALPWVLDVAKQFGLMGAVFSSQSCAVGSAYYHVYKGLLEVPVTGPVSLPGLPLLQVADLPSFVAYPSSYPHFFDVCVNQFCNFDGVDWVIFNNFYELEKEAIDWMAKKWRMVTIGPTVPSMYLDKRLEGDKGYGINVFKPDTSACLNWLQNKPSGSVVYVSYGSVADLEKEQTEELAWGLKGSNCYFLWVVRESDQHKLPNNFIQETSDKGLIVSWSPQLEVLSHKSVGCFVTHCGFNSVMEAICLGVPMVAMPLWTDQTTNAKYVEDVWKVGVRATRDENGTVTRQVLEKCITHLMVDGEKRRELIQNAKKLKKLAVEALEEGGSSDKAIDEFIYSLISS